MRPIVHQTMVLKKGCMSACLAMLTDQPVDRVTKEFHNSYYHMKEITPEQYLTKHGVETYYEERSADVPSGYIKHGHIYLLSMPSLNGINETHAIVLDMRGEVPLVYDPCKGRADARYVAQLGAGIDQLRCWSIELIIRSRVNDSVLQ
jgi:hypothetical protein